MSEWVAACCESGGAGQPSCSLCPAPGTTLLPSASLPPDDPYSPGAGCADMDAYVQSDAFCQPSPPQMGRHKWPRPEAPEEQDNLRLGAH